MMLLHLVQLQSSGHRVEHHVARVLDGVLAEPFTLRRLTDRPSA
jgi:hypothetical protein